MPQYSWTGTLANKYCGVVIAQWSHNIVLVVIVGGPGFDSLVATVIFFFSYKLYDVDICGALVQFGCYHSQRHEFVCL